MPDKAVPELVLPDRARCSPVAVDAARRYPFHILDRARDHERVLDTYQCMPVVGHEHVTAQPEAQLLSRFFHGRENQREFVFRQSRKIPAQVCRYEEDAVGYEEPPYARHGFMVDAVNSIGKWVRVATARFVCRGLFRASFR